MLSNKFMTSKNHRRDNLAIFASGSGSNAENIIQTFSQASSDGLSPLLPPRPAVILSNNPRAGVLERAKRLSVPARVFSNSAFAEGIDILHALNEYEVSFIVLAGFMNKITAPLLDAFPNRILNIHPALLPRFGGKGMYGHHVHEAVLAAGERQSGITIHFINEHYDEGDILFQATCPVLPDDTPDTLATRIHALEHVHYPRIIAQTFYGRGSASIS
ncbi:MAG: phosphoribosylglycinamide formyltransferase [Tannerellaceae bacterium]|jgi:phosphoribosylglycinamide formyltransferase-1|nr:phosphoribosylglycinamide formyltransferase [Tannerellaceae bacterium]